jgi:site-specific DNA recombinase
VAETGKEQARALRCAIYTRKSTEEGLEQAFNTLQAQREAAEAYIQSQKQAGWVAVAERYDDGGFSGACLERPALQQLLAAIDAGAIDCMVVYKVDRLSRSLLDFARLMERFDRRGVQHHHLAGRADVEHFARVCTIRTGDHIGAYARQAVGGAAQRQVDRRLAGAGL